MGIMRITATNRNIAIRNARKNIKAIYGKNYVITDIIYNKGTKIKNYQGKIMKRYGIVFRKKK